MIIMGQARRFAHDPGNIVERVAAMVRSAELEELASAIAHSMNQPLGAIAAFAQAGSRVLDRSQTSAGRAAEIFNEIGRIALDAGADMRRIRALYTLAPPADRPSQMPDLVAEMQGLLLAHARESKARLEFEFAEALPDVRVDRLQVQYVLLCLVQHALDATASAGDEAAVSIVVRGDGGGVATRVAFAPVTPPSGQDADFPPAFAIDAGVTGFGLWTCRSIIAAHGGKIEIGRPDANSGCFSFRLPAAEP